MDDEILSSLLKRALGYTFKEVQEEFGVDESGEMTLTKRKIHDKYFPPDGTALKTYLELCREKDIPDFSDEELEKEKLRLLRQLKELEESASDGKDDADKSEVVQEAQDGAAKTKIDRIGKIGTADAADDINGEDKNLRESRAADEMSQDLRTDESADPAGALEVENQIKGDKHGKKRTTDRQ